MDDERDQVVLEGGEIAQLGHLLADDPVLAPEAREGPHSQQELAPVDRLGEKIVGARLETCIAIVGGVEAGHQQHGQELVAFARGGLDGAAGVDAARSRHHHVQHHDVEALLLDQAKGRLRIARLLDLEGGIQLTAAQTSLVGVVVDDEDPGLLVARSVLRHVSLPSPASGRDPPRSSRPSPIISPPKTWTVAHCNTHGDVW